MILRHRCRSLFSNPSFKTLSHHRHPRHPSSSNPYRGFRTTSSRQAENESPYDIDQSLEDLSPSPESESRDVTRQRPSTSDLFGKRAREEDDEERGFQTYDQIDASMNIEELGLKKLTRKGKKSFLRWIMQEGTRYERFPQHILMRLEARRIEKARKGSEDRMFQRMNAFFDTVSFEEIIQGKLFISVEKKAEKKNMERVQQPEPTPFQQLITGQIETEMSLKQIESKALSLLREHDQELHTLYKNYIDWCDYQLQKQRIWFEFPNIPKYADVIARSRPLTEEEIFKREQRRIKEERAAKAAKGQKKVETPEQVKATTQEGLRLDATEQAKETLGETTGLITGTDTKNPSGRPGETTETATEPELQEAEDQPLGEDLAYHLGPRIDETSKFPILGTPSSNYLASRGNSPFRLNSTFKPWRPIPHSIRLKMFDAWREGLGLRNVSWLGGVSWRRVDGIIGILKREWQFVEKGGKLENEMASYMDALLAETPLIKPKHPRILLEQQRDFSVFPIVDAEDLSEQQRRYRNRNVPISEEFNIHDNPIPLADPKMEFLSGGKSIVQQQRCPMPNKPIFFLPQTLESIDGKIDLKYKDYVEETAKLDENNRIWEASQKEPLVEIPIKRTKQYFAIIQEMEEYSEKRAAKALDGVDGNTMTENEEGIKLFERFFGGLRSLRGREKFQGIPPWERNYSERERAQLAKEAERLAKLGPYKQKLSSTVLTPADAFRVSHTSNADNLGEQVSEENRKERVIWRFEDVTWVKQRTIRPRKQSYVGTLDQRVQIESGVQRYGPYGIGGGVIEGVGGVKNVIERGLDGEIRQRSPGREKRRVRREIVV